MEYEYIHKYCKLMGSMPYYLGREIQKARADKAPETAYANRQDGTWYTTDGITSTSMRQKLGLPWCHGCDKYRKQGVPHMPERIFDDTTETVHDCRLLKEG